MGQKLYQIGLTLSGGGAKGAAHCGAIQAMEEYGLVPEVISGTSVGSLVGAFYAGGMKPIDLVNLFSTKDFKNLFNLSVPKAGLFDQKPLIELMNEKLPVKNFEELKIAFLAVACNLDKGSVTVFNKGELAPRIMASCSIPVFFYPMKINGTYYVDGGVLENFPVNRIRKKCRTVIGINVLPLHSSDYKHNMLSIAMRSFTFMLKANASLDAKMCDILVNVNTSDYSQFDLSNIQVLFELGYNETVAALEAKGYTRKYPKEKLIFKLKKKKPELF